VGTERLNRSNSSPKNRLKSGSFWKGKFNPRRLVVASTSMLTTAGEKSLTILTTGLLAFLEGTGAADANGAEVKIPKATNSNTNILKEKFLTRMS
jgi:hypothetical protein